MTRPLVGEIAGRAAIGRGHADVAQIARRIASGNIQRSQQCDRQVVKVAADGTHLDVDFRHPATQEIRRLTFFVDDQTGSPTYTKDLAKAIRVLLDTGCLKNYGVYHVSNSGRVSWCDYAKKILEIVGSKTEVLPISSISLARPAKRPAMSELDNSKFIKLLNPQK